MNLIPFTITSILSYRASVVEGLIVIALYVKNSNKRKLEIEYIKYEFVKCKQTILTINIQLELGELLIHKLY